MIKFIQFEQKEICLKKPILKKCFFFIPLRVACLIIVYVNMILTAIRIIELFNKSDENERLKRIELINNGKDYEKALGSETFVQLNEVSVVLTILGFGNILWMCILISNCVGMYMKVPEYLKIYMIIAFTKVVVTVTIFGITVYNGMHDVVYIAENVMIFFVSLYCLAVYMSYTAEMEMELATGSSSNSSEYNGNIYTITKN